MNLPQESQSQLFHHLDLMSQGRFLHYLCFLRLGEFVRLQNLDPTHHLFHLIEFQFRCLKAQYRWILRNLVLLNFLLL